MEGPSKGSSVQGGPAHIFFAAPSLLLLLLFKFVVVSMGRSSASLVVRVVLSLGFFLDGALVSVEYWMLDNVGRYRRRH